MALEEGTTLDDHRADMQDSTSEEVDTKETGERSLAEVTFSKYKQDDDNNDDNAQDE